MEPKWHPWPLQSSLPTCILQTFLLGFYDSCIRWFKIFTITMPTLSAWVFFVSVASLCWCSFFLLCVPYWRHACLSCSSLCVVVKRALTREVTRQLSLREVFFARHVTQQKLGLVCKLLGTMKPHATAEVFWMPDVFERPEQNFFKLMNDKT